MSAVLSATATSLAGASLPIFPHNRRIVVGERVGERTDGQAGLQCRGVGQFRHERAVDEHEPAALDVVDHGAGAIWRAPWPRHRAGSRAALPRASARADRCTSSPRRGDAAGPRGRTHRRRRRAARDRARRRAAACRACAYVVRQRGLRRGLDHLHVSHGVIRLRSWRPLSAHAAASSADIPHSRAPRAPAPDPCRRCARCGPRESTCTTSGTI